MNWRSVLIILLMVGLMLGYFWLDSYMQTQAWASASNEKWEIKSTGWSLILYAWPVAFAGLLLGGGVISICLIGLYCRLEGVDHRNEIQTLKTALKTAKYGVETAEQREREKLDGERYALENKEKLLYKTREKLFADQERAQQIIQEAHEIARMANERVEQAEKAASFAEIKRDRAAGAFHRMKQKTNT
ncbi:hypothetical protein [Shewanella psychromarinicola]|uniref:Uncharacterized protein n=1 Tax=Shewanella psychromarinicola TaxID=2487742 RepID=A0A3N4DF38_9GAMM|nr:hypothetical protein [Shewanella psychromarinicola]MCL1084337.1 hypothetical protein [Shewanella psychromarinicola]RPA22448.1 hypothetical protein EGC77_21980 [Shewanella psychromarinicola]